MIKKEIKMKKNLVAIFLCCTLFSCTSDQHPTGDPERDARIIIELQQKGEDWEKFSDEVPQYYLEKFGGEGADDKVKELGDALFRLQDER